MNVAAREKFRLGYAPNERYALRDFLGGKGCSAETMIEAGLLTHGPDINVPYDFFRDRLMFPICDRGGRVIAFGGRALAKRRPAQIQEFAGNAAVSQGRRTSTTCTTPARAAHERGTVVAVEGYVDVIAMTLAGFTPMSSPDSARR